MKSFKEIAGKVLQEVGEKECETCGSLYKIYETPRGPMGACKKCADDELKKNLKLPYLEELEQSKANNFIASFEKVSDDLKRASVNSYVPKHDSQIKAKQTAIKFVKEFEEKPSQSLVFSGDPGLGKSHLSYAIAKAVRSQQKKVLYIKVTDFLDHIKASYNKHSNVSEERIFEMAADLDLLVLDDIGSEYVKTNDTGHETWASDVLFKVFDMRLNKATICTTNYSERDLQEKYGNNGPRIISRMMNGATGIRLQGDDYRRQEAF
ncbi:ATP-binding protein [Halobacillus ihumii]|uniref:ATP-binding protein n=1 Tax=Halobacillus ihumii TaxID=2686092 RepID=UPI0013D0F5B6|nr:ATP-binding protein [Halobacillus ihumii]